MKSKPITHVMIIVLIIITTFSLFKTDQLTDQVLQLQMELNSTQSSVSNQLRNIENVVYQMKDATQWYQEIEIPEYRLNEGVPQINLKFRLMEYDKGNQVFFHVKKSSSDTFEVYESRDLGNGIYELNLTEVDPIEPFLKFDVHFYNSDTEDFNSFLDHYSHNTVTYYISVEHENKVKTSEMHQFNLYELTSSFFQPLNGMIEIDDDRRQILVFLSSLSAPQRDLYYAIDQVTIQSYLDNKIVEFWDLTGTLEEEDLLIYEDSLEITKAYDSLYIEVKYSGEGENNGLVHRRLLGSKR